MPWRRTKIRLDGREMEALRLQVFGRSEWRCENSFAPTGYERRRCSNLIKWGSFHLHHMVHRSQGGSDTKENTLAVCMTCHDAHHGRNAPIMPYVGWIP